MNQATKRPTVATPRELPASSPVVDSRGLVGLREPETVRHVVEPSFEFSRNGKGDPSWTIKAGGDGLEHVVTRVLALDERIRKTLGGYAVEPVVKGLPGDGAQKEDPRG